jgi:hypothetical protein
MNILAQRRSDECCCRDRTRMSAKRFSSFSLHQASAN